MTTLNYKSKTLHILESGKVQIPCFQSHCAEFSNLETAKAAVDRELAMQDWLKTHPTSEGFQAVNQLGGAA